MTTPHHPKTKLHLFHEAREEGRLYLISPHTNKLVEASPANGIDVVEMERFFATAHNWPHIVISPSVTENIPKEGMHESIAAMLRANSVTLPYPKLLVELELGPVEAHKVHIKDERVFVCIEQSEDHPNTFFVALFTYAKFSPSNVNNSMEVGILPRAGFSFKVFFDPEENLMFDVRATPPSYIAGTNLLDPKFMADVQESKSYAGRALLNALLLTNMSGIDRNVVECERLNRQRQRKNKPDIPPHSYIRLGTIYTSSGEKIDYNTNNGRRMPIHFRKAYARRQHFGEGRSQTKIVLIPHCFVNSDITDPNYTPPPTSYIKW